MLMTVVVCRGPVCGDRRDAAALSAHLIESIARRGLGDRVRVSEEVCLGHCLRGPNVLVCESDDPTDPERVDGGGGGAGGAAGVALTAERTILYNRMTVADLDRVIDRHLVGGIAVRPLMHRPPVRDPSAP
jgi:(2Fe-2S) ferredoxin